MNAATFRKLALGFPHVLEHGHMGHPDFRVAGKIFATLDYPEPGWAVLALTPYDQEVLVRLHPRAFVPVKGTWGERGATHIVLRHASIAAVTPALKAAYEARLARSAQQRGRARGGS